jgi:predicted DNA binding CopG/RHH family protein
MGKTIPTFKTDEEAELFVETADLSDYDLSGFKPVHFEFYAKDRQINMRLPQPLLEAVKAAAKSEGVPYQRYIRRALERSVISNKA